jgi:hypothetical protein
MILGSVHRSSGIDFTAEENPKSSARRPSDEGPLFKNELGRIAQHVRKGERRKEERIGVGSYDYRIIRFISLKTLKMH